MIYIRALMELGLQKDKGVEGRQNYPQNTKESLYWYLTYFKHHLVGRGMTRSKVDTRALLNCQNEDLIATFVPQVYDTGQGRN